MPDPSLFRRALHGALLSGAILLLTTEIASASTLLESAADVTPTPEDGDSGWGPIVGACLGVLFGGMLAIWQIRGMKNRR
jgi:hypothetical protein